MTVTEYLRKKIREEMNNLADDVATGSPKDWAEYQRLVGKIEGLAIAEVHINYVDALDADGEPEESVE